MPEKQSRPLALNQYIVQIVEKKNPETVQDIIKLVQLKYPIAERDIMKHILHLQSEEKLIFKDHQRILPSTAKGYLFSTEASWYWTIIALALATTIAVFTIPEEAFPIVYARYILGSLFVLFFPGYSFTKALFPAKELANIERVALSIGMSLALVPIAGLLLNYTPWGIRVTPVTLSLLALTLSFATAAAVREHQAELKANEG